MALGFNIYYMMYESHRRQDNVGRDGWVDAEDHFSGETQCQSVIKAVMLLDDVAVLAGRLSQTLHITCHTVRPR